MTTSYRQTYDKVNQSRLNLCIKDGIEFTFLPAGKRRERVENEIYASMGEKDIWDVLWMKENIRGAPDITFILQEDKPIGVMSFDNLPFRASVDADTGLTIQLNFVYLLPEYRGKGLSKYIYDHMIETAMDGMEYTAQASSLQPGNKMVMGVELECVTHEGFRFHNGLMKSIENALEVLYLSNKPLSEMAIEIKDFSDLGDFENELPRPSNAPQP